MSKAEEEYQAKKREREKKREKLFYTMNTPVLLVCIVFLVFFPNGDWFGKQLILACLLTFLAGMAHNAERKASVAVPWRYTVMAGSLIVVWFAGSPYGPLANILAPCLITAGTSLIGNKLVQSGLSLPWI